MIKNKKRLNLIILIFAFFFSSVKAQILLSGKVTDDNLIGDLKSITEQKIQSWVLNTDSHLNQPNMTINNANSVHTNGFNNNGFKMEYFPSNLGETFLNLKQIKIIGGNLKEIHKNDLKNMKNLIRLDFSQNDIQELEENLFSENPKLEHLNLSQNKIKFIDKMAFENTLNLNVLKLANNKCINENAEGFHKTQNLIEKTKNQCLNLDERIKNLEDDQKMLNSSLQKIKRETENVKTDQQIFNNSSTIENLKLTTERFEETLKSSSETQQNFISQVDSPIFSNLSSKIDKLLVKFEKTQAANSRKVSLTNFNFSKNLRKSDFLLIISVTQTFFIIIILIILIVILKATKTQKPPEYETVQPIKLASKKSTTSREIKETSIYEDPENLNTTPKNDYFFTDDYAGVQILEDYAEIHSKVDYDEIKNFTEGKVENQLPEYASVDLSMKSKNRI